MEEDEILSLKIDEIQKECHRCVEFVKSQKPVTFNYQDATNIFLFKKLAEQEIRLQRIESLLDL